MLASLSALPPGLCLGHSQISGETGGRLGESHGRGGNKVLSCSENDRTGFVAEPEERLDQGELRFESRSLKGAGRGHRGNAAGTTTTKS